MLLHRLSRLLVPRLPAAADAEEVRATGPDSRAWNSFPRSARRNAVVDAACRLLESDQQLPLMHEVGHPRTAECVLSSSHPGQEMSAERENLAQTIVRAYQSIGIPAKVHRGMVLIQRDAEMAGPFHAELLAPLYRQEIETIKNHVLAKLETYGIIEILKRFSHTNRSSLFQHIIHPEDWLSRIAFRDCEDLVRVRAGHPCGRRFPGKAVLLDCRRTRGSRTRLLGPELWKPLGMTAIFRNPRTQRRSCDAIRVPGDGALRGRALVTRLSSTLKV